MPRASVIVASRGRPGDLMRCLTALGQQDHPDFEIVVAADAAGRAAAERHPLGPAIKIVPVDYAGVSRARNRGLGAAAGEIVAFIDDDAVPEPTWLSALCGAFGDVGVGAATGTVLGRNGITPQWYDRVVGPDGSILPRGAGGGITMLEGTNMAIRRSLLERIGAFDSAYSFGYDDADMAMRVAVSGAETKVVPHAIVHHGFSASERRRADRAPLSLHELGESTAVFLRRHGGGDIDAPLAARRNDVRAGLIRALVDGRLEPRDVGRVLAGFDAGVSKGLASALGTPPSPCFSEDFKALRFNPRQSRHIVLAGRPWRRRALEEKAKDVLRTGAGVTLVCLWPGAAYHRIRYCDAGYWVQTGGTFGRSERSGPLVRWVTFRRRVEIEAARVAAWRGIADSKGMWRSVRGALLAKPWFRGRRAGSL